MSEGISIWSAERPDLAAVLGPLGWQTAGDDYERSGKGWSARTYGPRPVLSEEAPEEARELVAGIAWFMEIGIEGGADAALRAAARAANALARAGHGVIVDEGGDDVRVPGGVRRIVRQRVVEGFDLLTLSWWFDGGPLQTRAGVRRFVEVLHAWLPEAVPTRWDQIEPPSHLLSDEGLDGLSDYLYRHGLDVNVVRTEPPFLGLTLRGGAPPSERNNPNFQFSLVELAIDGRLLEQPGWPRQLARAFEELSVAIRPFYAEARLRPGGRWDRHGGAAAETLHPIGGARWRGFPHVPPFAMVVGPPYLELWRGYAASGPERDGLALFSSDHWPEAPPGGLPALPEGFLQEFDTRFVYFSGWRDPRHPLAERASTPGTAVWERERARYGFTSEVATRHPAVWPFEKISEE